MLIVADLHERESGIAAELTRLGADVEERQLAVGDYLVEDIAIIERKTVSDLHQSVQRGRFWSQIGRLRGTQAWPYLLIEGPSLYRPGLADESVRGLILAVSDLGVTVCRSECPEDSARWIRRIAARRTTPECRDRPRYAQRPRRTSVISPAEQALAAAPEISVATARALLSRFGTLMNVLTAERDELRAVPGVGPRRADAVCRLAVGTSHSGLSRNGVHLAT